MQNSSWYQWWPSQHASTEFSESNSDLVVKAQKLIAEEGLIM